MKPRRAFAERRGLAVRTCTMSADEGGVKTIVRKGAPSPARWRGTRAIRSLSSGALRGGFLHDRTGRHP